MRKESMDKKKIPGLIEGGKSLKENQKTNIKRPKTDIRRIPKEKNPRQVSTLPWKYIFPLISLAVIFLIGTNFEAISTFIVEKMFSFGIYLAIILWILARLIKKLFTGNLNTIFLMWLFNRGDKDE